MPQRTTKSSQSKSKKKRKLKKQKHVCRGVQGGAEVYCDGCGKVLYA